MNHILIIEDDRRMNEGIAYFLQKEGFCTSSAYSRKEARDFLGRNIPDLILLDVNLPDGEGFSFCRHIKQQHHLPVLFLTARDLEEDALKGYEMGAEDYITKPFSMKILLKKIQVQLKNHSGRKPDIYSDGYLTADFDAAKVFTDGKECFITPTEFRLLRELISHAGQLLTYSVLLERLWDCGGQFVDKHALAVNVNRLRKKIEDEEHKYIVNVYGMGYQWLKS